ncbi:MAG TPA: LuxR C-terminal-related transcriptional regulator [Solirubrobacteraceae bacterium]|nr:LuxR C-terminal-related transcriptional regulator [Solirubrobacteraceae bacterium]
MVQSSYTLAANLSMQAIEIAEGHGWSEEPIAGIAYMILGGTLVGQGRLEEAARWLRRAGRALRAEVEPSATVVLHDFRGILELASGRYEQALESFRTTERLARRLVTAPEEVLDVVQPYVLETLVKMGEAKQAAEALAELGEEVRPTGHLAVGVAVLRLAQDDQHAAVAALAPILDGSVPVAHPLWKVEALLLDAVARDALGDAAAAARSLERALELAAPESILLPFLLHPAPRLLAYHRRHRANHGALVSAILNLQADPEPASPLREPEHLREPLTERELRVLRYLPTNLSLREIADELGVSVSTIKTHIEHLYAKLDVHRRREAVERARALGLIASAPHGAETSPTPE